MMDGNPAFASAMAVAKLVERAKAMTTLLRFDLYLYK
jgi:hypothetical protein